MAYVHSLYALRLGSQYFSEFGDNTVELHLRAIRRKSLYPMQTLSTLALIN